MQLNLSLDPHLLSQLSASHYFLILDLRFLLFRLQNLLLLKVQLHLIRLLLFIVRFLMMLDHFLLCFYYFCLRFRYHRHSVRLLLCCIIPIWWFESFEFRAVHVLAARTATLSDIAFQLIDKPRLLCAAIRPQNVLALLLRGRLHSVTVFLGQLFRCLAFAIMQAPLLPPDIVQLFDLILESVVLRQLRRALLQSTHVRIASRKVLLLKGLLVDQLLLVLLLLGLQLQVYRLVKVLLRYHRLLVFAIGAERGELRVRTRLRRHLHFWEDRGQRFRVHR